MFCQSAEVTWRKRSTRRCWRRRTKLQQRFKLATGGTSRGKASKENGWALSQYRPKYWKQKILEIYPFFCREAIQKEKEKESKIIAEQSVSTLESKADDDEETKAAVVLQSNYRGFKERKRFKERKTATEGGSGDLAMAPSSSQVELDGGKEPERKEEEIYEDEESTYEAEEDGDDSDHTQVPEDDSYLEAVDSVELEDLVGLTAKEEEKEEEAVGGNVDEETRAATVLQSNFRGHKERQRLQEEGKIPARKSRAEKQEVLTAQARDDVGEPLDVSSIEVVLENQDETRAAVVLQSNFRGHKERKRLQEEGKIPARKGRAEEREVPMVEEEETSLSATAEEEERAATVLQSNFRGHQERKKLRATRQAREEAAAEPVPVKEEEEDDNNVDDALDVNDIMIGRWDEAEAEKERQEEEHAAVKIQSNFRGYKDRKNLRANQHAARTQAAQLESFSMEVRLEVQEGAQVSGSSLAAV